MDRNRQDISPWVWLAFPVALITVVYFIAFYDAEFYYRWIAGELGLLELGQPVIVAVAACYGVRILALRPAWPKKWLGPWTVLLVLGCVYVVGEEISWGQHFFGWGTPEWIDRLNDQGETNLHNVSSWFDQKPRVLLEFAVIIGGILYPLWSRYAAWKGRKPKESEFWLWPSIVCLPTAVLAEVSRLPERLFARDEMPVQGLLVRHSEMQEFFFYLFILIYLISLHFRIAQRRATAPVTVTGLESRPH